MEKRKCPLLPKAAPWLVFPCQKEGNKQNHAFYNICEPNNRTRKNFIPELSGKSYWQKHSHQGWLVVVCDDRDYKYGPKWKFGDCFLWNPASLETIQLPSLKPWYCPEIEYRPIDCVLSSPPRTSTIAYPDKADEPMVLMLFVYSGRDGRDEIAERYMFLIFCHPGDKKWKPKWVWSEDATDIYSITALCCFKEKLYLMCIFDRYLEINKAKLWDKGDGFLALKPPFETTNSTGDHLRGRDDHIDGYTFYVESSVELFRVLIHFNRGQNMKVFNSAVVFRLDFSSKELKVVTCLGDHVLFVGDKTKACCSASKLGLATGCLYYTHSEDPGLYKFEVQNSGNSVILPCLELPKQWFPSDWIMVLDGRQQKEEEDCMAKAVENVLSLMRHGKNENKDRGFEETSTSTAWDILDADCKELIAHYLHSLDYMHFRSVSKPIRAMMPVSKPKFATTSIMKTSNLCP